MVAVTDLKAWTSRSFLKKGERFQFGGQPYVVLQDHTTGDVFNRNSANVTIDYGGGGGSSTPGEDGRGITSVAVSEGGDLIVTYTDTNTENAGHIVGAAGSPGGTTTLVTHADTDYILALSDAEKYNRFISDSTKTVHIPANVDVPFPFTSEGETTTILLFNAGSGVLTIDAGAISPHFDGNKTLTVAQGGVAKLVKVEVDEWDISGDLVPAG